MGIKSKSVIIILSSFLILILGEYVIMNVFFMSNIITQEKNVVNSESKRAEYMINQYKSNLVSNVKDWAPWDDTLRFINEMDMEYIAANFSDVTMDNLKINIVVFFDKNQKIKYSIAYDSTQKRKIEVTDRSKVIFEKNSDLICKNTDLKSSITGIIKLDTGGMIIASAPITDSMFRETNCGTLLFGRFIDDNMISSIEKITNSNISILDINNNDTQDGIFLNSIKKEVLKSTEAYITPYNKKSIRGYSILRGLNKAPLYFLQVNMNRNIYNNGKRATYFFEYMSIIIIIIITLVCIILLQKNIIFPIVKLGKSLESMDIDNYSPNTFSIKGKDEISNLSKEIDKMLIKIKDKSKVEKELAYLSFYDKLTGLYNRGYFEYLLGKKIKSDEYPISIIVGDINGLKIINDTFGQTTGDNIILSIADILKKVAKDKDIVSRWGGDEFAIILLKSNDESAEEFCNIVREKCSMECIGPVALNISFGYSHAKNIDQDTQEAIKEAEERMYRNKLFESNSARNSIISSLKRALVEKSNETEEHTSRIYDKCIKMGKRMNLSKAKTDELALLAFLHDIGKIAIPDYILNKPEALSREEWDIMKTHTEIGHRIASATHELSHISYAILTHHEYFNGSGYPKGLKGGEIPIISRIISILDAYDVMTHERPYKRAITVQEAFNELRRCSGTQFDPELVEICIDVLNEDLNEY